MAKQTVEGASAAEVVGRTKFAFTVVTPLVNQVQLPDARLVVFSRTTLVADAGQEMTTPLPDGAICNGTRVAVTGSKINPLNQSFGGQNQSGIIRWELRVFNHSKCDVIFLAKRG